MKTQDADVGVTHMPANVDGQDKHPGDQGRQRQSKPREAYPVAADGDEKGSIGAVNGHDFCLPRIEHSYHDRPNKTLLASRYSPEHAKPIPERNGTTGKPLSKGAWD